MTMSKTFILVLILSAIIGVITQQIMHSVIIVGVYAFAKILINFLSSGRA